MGKIQNLQEAFLNHVRATKMVCVLFLVNGFQLRGIITAFDNFVLMVETDGKQQMIYKHAISTIVPSRYVPLNLQEEEDRAGK